MANKITKINNNPVSSDIVTSSSRYANSALVYYGDTNKMTFTTYKKSKNNSSDSDRYTIVNPGQEYRPDLVSMEAYGTVDFWWRIMEFNGLKDIMQFKAGTNLIIPPNILI